MTKIEMLNSKGATVNVNGHIVNVAAVEWQAAGVSPAFRDIEIRRIAEYKHNYGDTGPDWSDVAETFGPL